MITLIDIGQMFWTAYFGFGKSALSAFEYTLERCEWYANEHRGETVVCCDSPVSRRKQINPTYKAHREKKPQDAIEALRDVQDKLEHNGVPIAMAEGYEADDLIATLQLQAFPAAVQIIGSEKDFFCLLSDTVSLIGPKGPVTPEDVERKFSVNPGQMTDFLAIMGDTADGIKGVEGIGQKKAAALLAAFGDIEGVKKAYDSEILELRSDSGKKLFNADLIAAIRAWDPESALELVRLEYDAPVSLHYLLSSDADDSSFPMLD